MISKGQNVRNGRFIMLLNVTLLSEMPQVFTDIPSALDLYNPQGLQNYLKTF